MTGKFMKIIIPFTILVIMTSQLVGCAATGGVQSADDVVAQDDSSIGVIGSKDEEKQPLSGDTLTKYFQLTYDSCSTLESDSQEEQLNFELDMLVSFCDTDGKKLPADYAEQYKSWRPADQQAPESTLKSTTPSTQQSDGNTQTLPQGQGGQQQQLEGQQQGGYDPDADAWDPYAGMTPEEKEAQIKAAQEATQKAVDGITGAIHN